MNGTARALAILAAGFGVLWLVRWLDSYPTWRLFFAWPVGGTWSNMIASAEWVAVAGLLMWVFRDHVGKHLAAWWAHHHGPHAIAQHREALRQHEQAKEAK